MKEIAVNRKAFFEYFIDDEYECGIVLVGSEVKSIRLGHLNLNDSYAIIKNGEVFLINAHIPTYEKTSTFKTDERRNRKLLLKKSEILKLERLVKEKKCTLVPLKAYFSKSNVKILLGVARGKHLYDKRETIKQNDLKKEAQRAIKNIK